MLSDLPGPPSNDTSGSFHTSLSYFAFESKNAPPSLKFQFHVLFNVLCALPPEGRARLQPQHFGTEVT